MRKELALGLIETRGLVAAIEACDAALKTAEVKLVSIDRVDAGLMTVKIVGEVAAVQSAVEAGQMAAARVGTLVAAHVIPRPDTSLYEELIYVEVRPHKKQPAASNTKPSASAGSHISPPVTTRLPHTTPPPATTESETPPFESMTVQELRRYARTLANFPIQGREISRASKQTLIKLLRQQK